MQLFHETTAIARLHQNAPNDHNALLKWHHETNLHAPLTLQHKFLMHKLEESLL